LFAASLPIIGAFPLAKVDLNNLFDDFVRFCSFEKASLILLWAGRHFVETA